MKNIKEKIIAIAKDIDIDCIGFASVEDFEDIRPVLEERKQRGHLSGFEEKDIEKRISPKEVFPKVQSIISIGLSYHYKIDKPLRKSPYGKITKSSWGRDYHRVLQEKMKELMDCVQQKIMPVEYMAFVDTGPLVDRAVAYRAGLGGFGKNGFIINDKYGSWLCIGNILVDFKIEEDTKREEDLCGSCELCLRACPTGALEGPYQFNAQRCISYLTQKKEILTEEERKSIGNNIYGCDICQLSCPHNREAKYSSHEGFKPDPKLAFPDIGRLLNISNREFKETFQSISAGWRGKKVLQRNAIIALGNSKDPRAIPLLKESLKDMRWDIRLYTIWALNQFGEEGRAIIDQWKDKEKDSRVIQEIKKLSS